MVIKSKSSFLWNRGKSRRDHHDDSRAVRVHAPKITQSHDSPIKISKILHGQLRSKSFNFVLISYTQFIIILILIHFINFAHSEDRAAKASENAMCTCETHWTPLHEGTLGLYSRCAGQYLIGAVKPLRQQQLWNLQKLYPVLNRVCNVLVHAGSLYINSVI